MTWWAFFEAAGVSCQPLNVSHAFHSPLVRPAVDGFEGFAAAVPARAPEIAWISTVSGALMTQPPNAQYWRNHALGAVRFADGMKLLADMDVADFVEIGPGSTLLALGRQCVGTNDAQTWLGSLNKLEATGPGCCQALVGCTARIRNRLGWVQPTLSAATRVAAELRFERRRFWIEEDGVSRPVPRRSASSRA